jgi:hypothetical protein
MIIKEFPLILQNRGKRNVVGKAVIELHGDSVEIHGRITNPACVRLLNEHRGGFSFGPDRKK